MKKIFALIFCSALALLALLAPAPAVHAAPAIQVGGTIVTIQNPTNGMQFQPGQTIGVSSVSTAPGGISFVQLFVDNVYITTNQPPNGVPVPTFATVQSWTTTSGFHNITVRATSSQGVTGQATVSVNVGGSSPTNTPNPCVVGSRNLGDVTIPDNSVIQPGTSFQKTWQVQNTGTCIWISSYGLVNINNTLLGAQSPSSVPNTAPQQIVNISVNMVAPQQPGTYRSVWQMRAPNGYNFGAQFDAQIVVPSSGCSGLPNITSFYASPQNITVGQSSTLVWGQVSNADQIKLQTPAGSSPVTAPGQTTLSPQVTTTYILTAFCQGQRVDKVATVYVSNAPTPSPTPPPQSQNFIRLQPAQQVGFGAINVPVQYYYDNTNAPGQIQLTAFNSFGQIVGSSTVGAIPYSQQFTNVTVSIPSGYQNAVNIQGCIIDRTGNSLTCGSGLGIR